MISQYQYYGSAAHGSAQMKIDIARRRIARPELFKVTEFRQTAMDGDGKVTETLTREAKACPMTPQQRHHFFQSKRG